MIWFFKSLKYPSLFIELKCMAGTRQVMYCSSNPTYAFVGTAGSILKNNT